MLPGTVFLTFHPVFVRFYLPHGITTDKDNNYWVTDVALHQVNKVFCHAFLKCILDKKHKNAKFKDYVYGQIFVFVLT